MIPTDPSSRIEKPLREGWRRARADLFAGLVPLLSVAGPTWWLLDLPPGYLLQTLGLYTLSGIPVLRALPDSLAGPRPGIGPANRVTLVRATLVCSVAPLVFHAGALDVAARWWIAGVSAFAVVLDGIDGWTARRTASTTAFGARFDMEVDAFQLLALSILVWVAGQVGGWVVLIGALRYLFAGAGWIRPTLRGALPPSLRRRAACLVQGVALLVCLAPMTSPDTATPVAAAALALLIYSFGIDTAWLVRNARPSGWGAESSTAV